jgi:cobyric acid synthase
MGVTTAHDTLPPFAILDDGTPEGICVSGIAGTYLHGALENKAVLGEVLGRGLPEVSFPDKDSHYDRLAEWFSEHVNHDVLLKEYLALG